MPEAHPEPEDMVVVGRIGGAHGVRGWLRLRSYTDPPNNLCRYRPLWLRTKQGWKPLQSAKVRDDSSPGKPRLLLHLPGVEDRNAAELQRGFELGIRAADLPAAEPDSYYWRDLIGLTARSPQGDLLGQVKDLLDTPAHPVLVLELAAEVRRRLALDSAETLVPFVNEFTQEVDLKEKTLVIDWPEVFFPERQGS
ncbi:MAG: ribosome maturation factor RimM [Pseudomonadales bacterium]